MATANIQPNGDSSVQWTLIGAATHAGAVNEDEGSPSTAENIGATNPMGMDGYVDDFHMETVGSVSSVSQIQVYAYGSGGATYGGDASVDLYDGSSWQGYHSLSFFAGSNSWKSYTFTGLSMTQTDLDNCRVRFRADVSVSKSSVTIHCVYAVVTYTGTGGYGNNFNGVASANIGKISGVATADIDKVKGA